MIPRSGGTGVPQFARVRYENIYPGINLVFYGNQGRLEYDFQVAPGSDPAQAELEFNGAKQLRTEGRRAGHSQRRADSVQLEAPRVYQEIAGRQQPVEGSFVLRGANRAGFAIGPYDHSRELVIDPILTFSTYFGGSGDEHATSIAVDGSFNIYLAGSTTSPNLPAAGVFSDGSRRRGGAERLHRQNHAAPGPDSGSAGVCDLSGRRRNRYSGRNRSRWRGAIRMSPAPLRRTIFRRPRPTRIRPRPEVRRHSRVCDRVAV